MNVSDYKVHHNANIKLKDHQCSEGKKGENDYIEQNIIPPLVEKLKELHLKLHAEEKMVLWLSFRRLMPRGKMKQFPIFFQI